MADLKHSLHSTSFTKKPEKNKNKTPPHTHNVITSQNKCELKKNPERRFRVVSLCIFFARGDASRASLSTGRS